MKSTVVAAAALFAILMCSFGCRGKGNEEVENFIPNYLSILQAVHADANLNLLVPVATEKELKKVFPTVQTLQATGNRMPTEILEFRIKGSKVKGEQATVTTSERWRFWWVDRGSGAVTKPKSEEAYNLEYHLVKIDGNWKVDSIKNVKD